MSFKLLYIDDEISTNAPNDIASSLNKSDILSCKLNFPPEHLSDISEDYDAYLLDLDLSSVSKDGHSVGYRGSALAAELRLSTQTSPIILVTRQTIIDSASWWRQILESNIDVDSVIYKGDFLSDPETYRSQIITLIEGYKLLSRLPSGSWLDVLNLLGADDESRSKIKESNPPVNGNNWNIPHTARWIRQVLMKYPGVMFDALYASARLGIDIQDYKSSEVMNYFSDTLYQGPFANDASPHWWSTLLLKKGTQLVIEQNLHGPIHKVFGEAFSQAFGVQLRPSECVYDKSANANYVCYLYQSPVQPSNSVPYYPDNRPSSMETARVSFRAIKELNAFDELLVADTDLPLVHKLWDES
jgi:hypothetical protein